MMWVRNWDFHKALQEVGSLLGVQDARGRTGDSDVSSPIPLALPATATVTASDEWLQEALRSVWAKSVSLSHASAEPARLYLKSRGILAWDRPSLEHSVRFHPQLTYVDEQKKRTQYPGIVALISDSEKSAVTIQRIFLTAKGEKAPVEHPKRMFPIPSDKTLPGSSIQTTPLIGSVLDICEGLETALAIETATGKPVWPMVNTYLLEHFSPPPAVSTVRIWADKDRKEGGQKAALALKERLSDIGIKVQILLPGIPIPDTSKGVDWNDVLLQHGPLGFAHIEVCRF